MKILIAGAGKVGAALTRQLSGEGYDVTLIDRSDRNLSAVVDRYDVMGVQGNCATKEVLEQAGIRGADVLIAVTDADEINMLCCMTGRSLNPNVRTVARIRNPEYSQQIYEMRDLFGLDVTVNPENQAALEIQRLLKYPGFLRRDTFANGRVEIVELRIPAEGKLCDKPVLEINAIAGCRVLVCAVLRGGKSYTPDGSFVLKAGDRIFVTAPTDNLAMLLKNLGVLTRRVQKVMLCGGSRISYYLAQMLLKSGLEVLMIEQDYDHCVTLAEKLPQACVIHGDASSQSLLESEGVESCDALVALTGLDEINMVISLYGSSFGVGQVVTKLGHIENKGILNDLPLGSVVNPKELCSNVIVRYIRALQNQTGAALTVHTIADGQAEAVEFAVEETTRHCGIPLKHLRLRKGVLLASITRNGRTEIPTGDSAFRVGDTVVIVTSGKQIMYQLNDIFED